MMVTTEPADRQRSAVVGMMRLSVGSAANFTRPLTSDRAKEPNTGLILPNDSKDVVNVAGVKLDPVAVVELADAVEHGVHASCKHVAVA
jgi:hypothetical protein